MEKICPLMKGPCLEHGCHFYVHLTGLNPQTGLAQDEWNCAIAWLPMLLIENANETRKNSASVDKVANEIKGIANTPINIGIDYSKVKKTEPGIREAEVEGPKQITSKNGELPHG